MLNEYKGLTHLKSMNIEELKVLCEDIRKKIVDDVSQSGGHLASSLGAVEIAVALHYVFNSPTDSIIWDVGHQAYAHKLLTGRTLSGLRSSNGVSGFPKPSESKHDPFFAGHAGVSISEAAGLAKINEHNFSIAVIGDGSITSGIAYEAMNHAGHLNLSNLMVILNDNEMSISENVGALASFISGNIINSTYYQKMRSEVKALISSIPFQKKFHIDLVSMVKKIRSSAVNLISPDAFFETFGFRYVGPFDGHDLEVMIKAFRNIPFGDQKSPPLLFHVVTKKGKGYSFAEDDPSGFHGISCFDTKTGEKNKTANLPTFTSVFGKELVEIAKKDENVCAITAAMKEGTGLSDFSQNFPDRFYDVGIAEQHAVTFAVGLSRAGAKPVVSIYSTFMQRSYDQIIHDVALNNIHVVLCMDRAGLVGEDGPTHHGVFDISYLRTVPNLTVMAPSSAKELRSMLNAALLNYKTPVCIRYPRGCVPAWELNDEIGNIEHGKSRIIFENKAGEKHVSIFGIGISSYVARLAAEEVVSKKPDAKIRVYDSRFIKPLDSSAILSELKNSTAIITVEENMLAGGFGSAVLELITDAQRTCTVPFYRIGIGDEFIGHGTQPELRSKAGIDVKSVVDKILSVC
ncbi:MAG: 1-deoxy-D-xylulose-5-phosphate synthase [Pseudomonadota bacterium]